MKKYNFNEKLLFLILLISYSCSHKKEEDNSLSKNSESENIISLSDAQFKNTGIETANLATRRQSSRLQAYGRTFFPPENITTISTSYGGIIKSIHVIQGQYIHKGQTVAILEDPKFIDLQQDYLMTKSTLKLAQLDYERQKDLNQSKASSDKVYQLAENTFRSNQILLKALSEKLKLLGLNPQTLSESTITRVIHIRSNTSGFVSTVYANRGKYVSPSESILDIINLSNPYLKLKIYEKDLRAIHIGMRLNAYTNSDTTLHYSCIVKSINPQISQDGSTDVICSFITMNKPIYQNMNMIARIELSNEKVNTLPDEAIVEYEGKSYAFISLGNRRYKMIPILKGISENGQTEILDNLDIGANLIVVKGAYTLLMAMKNKDE